MKKLLLGLFVAIPGYLAAQKTTVFSQTFDSNTSSTVADYKSTSAGGSPIADNSTSRFESFGAATPPSGISYTIDADGLKINRASGSSQATALAKTLTPANGGNADFAFVQFDFNTQTSVALAPSGSTPLMVCLGEDYTSNSNSDDHDQKSYMLLTFYYPTASSNEFGIKVGGTGYGTFSGTQRVTWVVNRTAAPVTYTGPGGASSTLASAFFDVWIGNTKIDLTGASIAPKVAGKIMNALKFRSGATWVGHQAFKNVRAGFLKTDGSGNTEDALFNALSVAFDNNVSSTVIDYKITQNGGTVPVGTTGGPIAEASRWTSIPNPSTLTIGDYYSVDNNGFKFNRTNADVKQTAHIGGLNIPDAENVAFAKFDLTINQGGAYTSFTPLIFYFGNNFTNTSSDQASSYYQSIGLKFPSATETKFYQGANVSDLALNKGQSYTITWVINQGDSPVSYTGEDNLTHTLTPNGGFNIWVGNTLLTYNSGANILGENATETNDLKIKDFRIRAAAPWTSGGNFALKNLSFGFVANTVLPVKISKFTAKANTSSVVLNWKTESESNASHFNVTRSTDGANFSKIGQVAANNVASNYFYTDFSPVSSTNYYQLEQVDNNGKTEKSAVVSANIVTNDLSLDIAAASAKGITAQVNSPKAQQATITLTNQLGQVIASKSVKLQKGVNSIDFSSNYKGLVIATVQTAGQRISKKSIK